MFQIFTNFPHPAEAIDGIEYIEIMGNGNVGAGMKFRETRKFFGKQSTEEMTISEFEQDSRFIITTDTCGSHFETEFSFRERGNGTEVEVNVKPRIRASAANIQSQPEHW